MAATLVLLRLGEDPEPVTLPAFGSDFPEFASDFEPDSESDFDVVEPESDLEPDSDFESDPDPDSDDESDCSPDPPARLSLR